MLKPFYFLILVFLYLTNLGLAQSVTVRVINGKDKHPLPDQEVRVSLLYDKGEKAPISVNSQLTLKTDANGKTEFNLPQPPPMHLSISVLVDSSHWRCICILLDATRNIVDNGVVKTTENRKDKTLIVKAGEVLFIARPVSFWYRLLGPLERG